MSLTPAATERAAREISGGECVELVQAGAAVTQQRDLPFGFRRSRTGTSGIPLDTVHSADNGTIRQAIRVAGKIGKALQFDGNDDWVTVTDVTASPLDLSTAMTLEAWVNPTAMSGRRQHRPSCRSRGRG